MGILDIFFPKKNKIQYVRKNQDKAYGVCLYKTQYKLVNKDQEEPPIMPTFEDFGYWQYKLNFSFECNEYEGEKDYYSENHELLDDIKCEIIEEFAKGHIYLYEVLRNPDERWFDITPCDNLEDDIKLPDKDYGLASRNLIARYVKEQIEAAEHDESFCESFVLPIVTEEEVKCMTEKDLEKFKNMQNCYMRVEIGEVLYLFYNPNLKGFSDQEVFEKSRKIVEDKYGLEFEVREDTENIYYNKKGERVR